MVSATSVAKFVVLSSVTAVVEFDAATSINAVVIWIRDSSGVIREPCVDIFVSNFPVPEKMYFVADVIMPALVKFCTGATLEDLVVDLDCTRAAVVKSENKDVVKLGDQYFAADFIDLDDVNSLVVEINSEPEVKVSTSFVIKAVNKSSASNVINFADENSASSVVEVDLDLDPEAAVKSAVGYIMSPVVMPGDMNSVADVIELVVAVFFSSFFTDLISEGAVVE